jgi:TIR domain
MPYSSGRKLNRSDAGTKVFDFRLQIDKEKNWQEEIDRAISSSKIIVAILSPSYFRCPECREELAVELFPLHPATAAAVDAPHLQFQKNPRVAARKILHTPHLVIVPALLTASRNPGKQYESQSRRRRLAVLAIYLGCQIAGPAVIQNR